MKIVNVSCRGQGAAGYRKGKNPLGPPTVTDETMGIKIKERKKWSLGSGDIQGRLTPSPQGRTYPSATICAHIPFIIKLTRPSYY